MRPTAQLRNWIVISLTGVSALWSSAHVRIIDVEDDGTTRATTTAQRAPREQHFYFNTTSLYLKISTKNEVDVHLVIVSN
jgi:hypothetical protein